jgi:hypothetical protein
MQIYYGWSFKTNHSIYTFMFCDKSHTRKALIPPAKILKLIMWLQDWGYKRHWVNWQILEKIALSLTKIIVWGHQKQVVAKPARNIKIEVWSQPDGQPFPIFMCLSENTSNIKKKLKKMLINLSYMSYITRVKIKPLLMVLFIKGNIGIMIFKHVKCSELNLEHKAWLLSFPYENTIQTKITCTSTQCYLELITGSSKIRWKYRRNKAWVRKLIRIDAVWYRSKGSKRRAP